MPANINPELQKLLDTLDHLGSSSAYLISVKGSAFNNKDRDTYYYICSSCREFIDHTWNHTAWCELYEPEPLAEWLEKGQKNRK